MPLTPNALFCPDVSKDPDNIPVPPSHATTKKGDLYILGDHRLLCGDSSSVEDVDRLLDGQRIHLVNTDPPYNVKVEPRSNNAIAAGLSSFKSSHPQQQSGGIIARKAREAGAIGVHQEKGIELNPRLAKITPPIMLRPKDRPLENDFVSDEAFVEMLRSWFGQMSRALLDGRSFYIWGGYSNIHNYPTALRESKLYFSQCIIWVKRHPVMTRKDFMGNHEWAFYGWKEGARHYFHPEIHNATDVWEVKKINPQSMIHLTEKPAELASRAMKYSSKRGENVLDLFGGSGSTLIGAQMTGRRAFLMELDPLYCDVIVTRWEKFTQQKAQRIPAPPSAKNKKIKINKA